jgi:hypothetical protein
MTTQKPPRDPSITTQLDEAAPPAPAPKAPRLKKAKLPKSTLPSGV